MLGVDTWMLYSQTEDIGVIYLANGNPYYGNLPQFVGWFIEIFILDSLFTKEGTLRGEIQHEITVSSDPFFMMPLIAPRLMSYGHNYN